MSETKARGYQKCTSCGAQIEKGKACAKVKALLHRQYYDPKYLRIVWYWCEECLVAHRQLDSQLAAKVPPTTTDTKDN